MRIQRAVGAALAGMLGLVASAHAQGGGDPGFRAGGIVLGAPPAAAMPADSVPASGLQVAELHLTTQVAFGRPVDRVATFAPSQPAIFAWFRYVGGQPGAPLAGRLVLLAPAGEIEAATLAAKVAAPEDVGYFKFTAPADGWPEGRYRVDVISGGAPVRSQPFEVRGSR